MSEAVDPSDIRNWQRRDDRVTTSGKLEAKDIPRLAAIGVRHVVNLALDDHPEALADERALLESSGIEYTHIPVPFDAPTRSHVTELRAVLKSRASPCARPLHHELPCGRLLLPDRSGQRRIRTRSEGADGRNLEPA